LAKVLEAEIGANAMIKKLINFLREVRQEMDRVSWPTKDEVRESTVIVLLFSLFFAIFIFAVDQLLTEIVRILY
jgi:preprotein translocase subunit SecE